MKELIDQLRHYIAKNQVDKSIEKLQGVFSLANSEYYDEVLLLSARFQKLKSSIRKRIISKENENIEYNQILDSLLTLISEIEKVPENYKAYTQVKSRIKSDIKSKSDYDYPDFLNEALVQRLSHVKQKGLKINGLWIDDNLGNQSIEIELLSAIGVTFDRVNSSEKARHQITNKKYDLIISDISREESPEEGLNFLQSLVKDDIELPFIFYIADLDKAKGTPPFCFGITNWISELLHYVMDIIERNH